MSYLQTTFFLSLLGEELDRGRRPTRRIEKKILLHGSWFVETLHWTGRFLYPLTRKEI